MKAVKKISVLHIIKIKIKYKKTTSSYQHDFSYYLTKTEVYEVTELVFIIDQNKSGNLFRDYVLGF